MKNMINQLWASRDTGAKLFRSADAVPFGWASICDMWEREKARRDNVQIRTVPNLIQAYIERDAWTKLNVKPAKIMQVFCIWSLPQITCTCDLGPLKNVWGYSNQLDPHQSRPFTFLLNSKTVSWQSCSAMLTLTMVPGH